MREAPPQILIADRPSSWRDGIEQALRAETSAVRVTDDGDELLTALKDAGGPRVIIIGQDLKRLGGHEAFFQAKDNQPPGRNVFLVVETASDVELIELRRRGVKQIVYREAAIEDTAARIATCLFGQMRAAERVRVKVPATVTIREAEVRGQLLDCSYSGAKLTVPARKLSHVPPIGELISLRFAVDGVGEVVVRAEIKRVEHQKAVWGDRMILGVRFQAEDFDTRKLIETAVDDLRIQTSEWDDRTPFPSSGEPF
jgi:DNA-binding response OmpR family regulator